MQPRECVFNLILYCLQDAHAKERIQVERDIDSKPVSKAFRSRYLFSIHLCHL